MVDASNPTGATDASNGSRPNPEKFSAAQKDYLNGFIEKYLLAFPVRGMDPVEQVSDHSAYTPVPQALFPPTTKDSQSDWVRKNVCPDFVARFKMDGESGPDLGKLQQNIIKYMGNQRAHPNKYTTIIIEQLKKQKREEISNINAKVTPSVAQPAGSALQAAPLSELPNIDFCEHINPQLIFEEEHKEEIKAKLAEQCEQFGVDTKENFLARHAIITEMWNSAPNDDRIKCEQVAAERHTPPTQEQILKNQAIIQKIFGQALSSCIGWERKNQLGDVVLFTAGLFINGENKPETFCISTGKMQDMHSFEETYSKELNTFMETFVKWSKSQIVTTRPKPAVEKTSSPPPIEITFNKDGSPCFPMLEISKTPPEVVRDLARFYLLSAWSFARSSIDGGSSAELPIANLHSASEREKYFVNPSLTDGYTTLDPSDERMLDWQVIRLATDILACQKDEKPGPFHFKTYISQFEKSTQTKDGPALSDNNHSSEVVPEDDLPAMSPLSSLHSDDDSLGSCASAASDLNDHQNDCSEINGSGTLTRHTKRLLEGGEVKAQHTSKKLKETAQGIGLVNATLRRRAPKKSVDANIEVTEPVKQSNSVKRSSRVKPAVNYKTQM